MTERRRLPSTAAQTEPLLVASALVVLLGLQLIRVFLPLASFRLYDDLQLDPVVPALVALACFSAGVLAPAAARWLGLRRALLGSITGLGLARLVEQGLLDPGHDLWLSALGVAFFSLTLPLLVMTARQSNPGEAQRLGLAFVAGAALDGNLHILCRTLDLSWRKGPSTLLVVAPIVLLLGVASSTAASHLDDPRDEPSFTRRLPRRFALFGPWLFLELVIFQNPAALAARTGWSLPTAAVWITAGSIAAVLVAAPSLRAPRGPLRLPVILALPAGVALFELPTPLPALGILLGQVGAAAVLVLPGSPLAGAAGRKKLLALAPQATLVVLLFLTYAGYEYGFGWLEPFWPVLAATALAVPALRSLGSGSNQLRPPPIWGPVLTAATLLLSPAALWVTWMAPTSPPSPPKPALEEVTFITYNLHQGFRQDGRLDAEGLANTIAMSGADVIVLQEVSRGWVVNGSLDLFEWLRHRLGMDGRFAATAGRQWGNAVLSRLPIAVRGRTLPSGHRPLPRGYLDVGIDTGGRGLRLLATHLDHSTTGSAVRDLQVAALLEGWNGTPRTLIAGDLNADPASPEMARLRQAGWHDASELLPAAQRATFRRYGRIEQLDYIWATADLAFRGSQVLYSRASDHLPLLTTVGPATRAEATQGEATEP